MRGRLGEGEVGAGCAAHVVVRRRAGLGCAMCATFSGEFNRCCLTGALVTGTISFHVLVGVIRGRVAQLVEQRTENPRAEGSSPPPTTMNVEGPPKCSEALFALIARGSLHHAG